MVGSSAQKQILPLSPQKHKKSYASSRDGNPFLAPILFEIATIGGGGVAAVGSRQEVNTLDGRGGRL